RGAARAAVADLTLVRVAPPVVADARSREVDNRVMPFEGSRVDGGRADVPCRVARPGRRPHQTGHRVARPLERGDQLGPDEAVGAGDDDLEALAHERDPTDAVAPSP